ncbi:hypothetical protein CYMTET_42455 [Cymbomonas tetramitiformis]|uniref:Uncharacterized protein n=1 Tax=Cymbomonas tetramitiformis TaxID=36881 RepID=A0AAE0C445_9CHLO|nr:hypothetical protein CYMTET_42455 [Cymbomonas tetramitiformis]
MGAIKPPAEAVGDATGTNSDPPAVIKILQPQPQGCTGPPFLQSVMNKMVVSVDTDFANMLFLQGRVCDSVCIHGRCRN